MCSDTYNLIIDFLCRENQKQSSLYLNINGNIKTNGIKNKPCLQQDSIDAITDLLVD